MRIFMVALCTTVCLITHFQNFCVAENLVLYFGFEDGEGDTVTDLSGNQNHGKMEGDTGWTDGKYGKALNFGGQNGIVRVIHNHHFEFTEGITVCAWIRPTLIEGPGEWQLIAAKGSDIDEFFEVLLHPQGYIWMGWRFSTGRVAPNKSPNVVVKAKWQHVAVSFQSGDWWRVYLDGEKLMDYPEVDGKLYPVEAPLLLGTEQPFTLQRYYNGDMDEFAIYNRGLSQNEIRQILRGIEKTLTVEPTGKLSTTWGILKQ